MRHGILEPEVLPTHCFKISAREAIHSLPTVRSTSAARDYDPPYLRTRRNFTLLQVLSRVAGRVVGSPPPLLFSAATEASKRISANRIFYDAGPPPRPEHDGRRLRWKQSVQQKEGTILEARNILFMLVLRVHDRANRSSIEGFSTVRQRDWEIDGESLVKKMSLLIYAGLYTTREIE